MVSMIKVTPAALLSICDQDCWRTTSPDKYAVVLTTVLGGAAWVEAYFRFLFADSPEAKRFATELLEKLEWKSALERSVSVAVIKDALTAHLENPNEVVQSFVQQAVDGGPNTSFGLLADLAYEMGLWGNRRPS